MNHLSHPHPTGGITCAEMIRNIALNTGQPRAQIVEAEIGVAKDHFMRGLLDVDEFEAHVEHILSAPLGVL
jgi:hypothetical protein